MKIELFVKVLAYVVLFVAAILHLLGVDADIYAEICSHSEKFVIQEAE